jgi:hypothetical protein
MINSEFQHDEEVKSNMLSFPKLMKNIYSEFIVLFEMKKVGMIVHGGNAFGEIGEYSQHWDMNNFIDCRPDEIVKLSNKF